MNVATPKKISAMSDRLSLRKSQLDDSDLVWMPIETPSGLDVSRLEFDLPAESKLKCFHCPPVDT